MTPYQIHRSEWSDCRRCPLHETRSKVVLCRGQLPADVLFVGEAPGQSEDTLGRPFIGPAGKLLDQIIVEAVPRVCRLAFTNVIACIPYDEDGKKTSDPPDVAIKRCHPRLVDLICLARPEKIVAVGKLAAKQLGKTDVEFVEITHPAAILRANPGVQGLLYQKCVVVLTELFESFIPF